MILPFKKGLGGYDYGVPTSYNAHHLGVDWNTNFEPLACPEKSRVLSVSTGPEAGLALLFQPIGKPYAIRWVHLNKAYVKAGDIIEEGQIICQSGNSGSNTTGPHTHEDIWKNGKVTLKFEDTINPHNYYKGIQAMVLVNDNGTYYVEGELGYFGIAKVEFLKLLQKITGKVENRKPVGSQLGVVETADGFIIKEK